MKDVLYFDGQCPLCAHEISVLKRLQTGNLDFVDIHQLDESDDPELKAGLLRILHLKVGDQWYKGVDATVRAWSHTPYGWLLKPLRWRLVRPYVDKLYSAWAKRRYAKLYGCDACMELP